MSSICRFCDRTFSTRSGLSQHVKYCMLTSSEESSLISDTNDMSLGSLPNIEDIEEVRN
jgi:hypothetical protein